MKTFFLASYSLFAFSRACAQSIPPPKPVYPLPTEKQIVWHKMEMNAFIHFTTNTFTNKEWGYGDEQPGVFNPANINVNQWVDVLRKTGFKGAILTTKHHDGFCLWPSAYTEHSVKNSPYKNGNGDLVKEFSEACRNQGLKFGIYLSPWDRNRADYGSPSYITYYRNQLRELFTNYGPIFEMWFDGANGGDGYYGGANEKRRIDGATYYDWPNTIRLIRTMDSTVLFFSDAGPDIRWVGNEKGIAGETNWNTITPDTLYAGKAGINDILNKGSENGTQWIPAEVDVSIRPGWFYHAEEDHRVKTPEQLFEIYLSSVGRGSLLLLNIPPDKTGHFNNQDVKALEGFKKLLDERLGNNLAAGAHVEASNVRGGDQTYAAGHVTDGNDNTYWATDDDVQKASFTVKLPALQSVHYILLQEYIQLGQRVKAFTVEALKEGQWQIVGGGTTIGYKRILAIQPITTDQLRVTIDDAKSSPVIANFAIY